MSFAHLHLHTQYSLLDGAIKVSGLAKTIRERHMTAVAVTDHGHVMGLVDSYIRLRAEEIKPILGCETYVCSDHRDKQNRKNFHLILLCENNEGYKNLIALNSRAHIDGFYYHPRIDKTLLRKHKSGLIALSACLGGELAATYFNNGYEGAKALALEYQEIFGKGNYFLEVMPNGLAKQNEINAAWKRIAAETGIGIVATGDCHYTNTADAGAHDVLMAMQTNRELSDEKRLSHEGNAAYYIRTVEDMAQHLPDLTEGIENAAAIAERCNVTLDLDKPRLPSFPKPTTHEGLTDEEFLCGAADWGLKDRIIGMRERGLDPDLDKYKARLSEELVIINSKGFAGYFLIVWDFINYARKQGIPVGPGRGSGAGSLVAYALRITDLDPIAHGLLFERFLNPERVSMPDFDVDFCYRRRDEVVAYVQKKYGADRVAQIGTFISLGAKSGIDAVGKVHGWHVSQTKMITKDVPELVDGHTPTIEWVKKNSKSAQDEMKRDATARRIVETAEILEGLYKTTSTHAAGIVIAPVPLWEMVGVMPNRNDKSMLITQAGMEQVERVGLVKFDFLGLKNLTILDLALREIRKREPAFNLDHIPMDDEGVYKMLSEGDTDGVFQLVESGVRSLLKRLRPDRFTDIVAIMALYRPGPLEGGMVDDYVKRKHGVAPVGCIHPLLDPILASTYGVIVYQEQVMMAARVLAGYSLGAADNLRRAMGKKKKEIMDKERGNFLKGCEATGSCDPETAAKIFDLLAFFSGYGFNIAHATAYALIAYQTAYLKKRYPAEYLCALASCDQGNKDTFPRAVRAIRAAGVGILPPSVQSSELDCTIEKGAVRLGLYAIDGVGDVAAKAILQAREKGRFSDLFAFFKTVPAKSLTTANISALAAAGGFDELHTNRAQVSAAAETLLTYGAVEWKASQSGQGNLFGILGADVVRSMAPKLPEAVPWNTATTLSKEREALGFYLSSHPSRPALSLRHLLGVRSLESTELVHDANTPIAVCGIIVGEREIPGKNDPAKLLIKAELEDETGNLSLTVFAGMVPTYRAALALTDGSKAVFVRGSITIDHYGGADRRVLIVREIAPLKTPYAQALKTLRSAQAMRLVMDPEQVTQEGLERIRDAAIQHKGSTPLIVQLGVGGTKAKILQYSVTPDAPFVSSVADVPGLIAIEMTP